jgi:hypothetical protein
MIGQHMPAQYMSPAEFAMQCLVKNFGNLPFTLEEHCLTLIYCVVYDFCELVNFDYLVLRYLNTNAVPYKEFAKEWVHEGEV